MGRIALIAAASARFAAFAIALAAGGASATAADVEFSRDINPILSQNCFQCHGPDPAQRKGGTHGLRLDTAAGATENLGSGEVAIAPGHPEKSELVERITSQDPDEVMPAKESGKKLSQHEIELLTQWIKEGAKYSQHWSYIKPVRPPLPNVAEKAWPKNEIDDFILARLEKEGLKPSPEADRNTLIRRVSLDLTGLPPTPAEVDEFVKDPSPDAYEKLVDRLLGKPTYGEHWAQMWLDLARYADSAGYANDPARNIWPYRDYVIRSLNDDKPFDQFTIEQLAGDLLPHPTDEQLIATAFHRNTMTNSEGGTTPEEFRNAAIVDRVNTTMAVWMGTTINCAQCHSHKFDPITQEEFFRFFAIFNNTADANLADEAPLLSLYSKEQKQQRSRYEEEIARLEAVLKQPPAKLAAAQSIWEFAFPQESFAPELAAMRKQLQEEQKRLADLKPETVPIMRELPPAQGRVTKMQRRGNYLDVGKEVEPGTPAAFPPLPKGAPVNRLTLARWLVDENNPLTPRVLANRYWEQIFGIGIVATSEDFGSQGDQPFHPELLDWLATELIRSKWDTKALVRLLVTSAAYRQSSRVTPDHEQRDPDNRLLARGPRFRLSAEAIRDQALAVSGLLSTKMYGPPTRPAQPSSGLSAAFGGGIDWQTSAGEDKYRRGIYTTWRRSNLYPSMATFDAPSREVCSLRRVRTNTPLQALVTLNDPVFIEAAQALARRMVAEGGTTPAERAEFGIRLCLARSPHEGEVNRLMQLYAQALARYRADSAAARKMATEPLGPPPKNADLPELASWTVVGNILLNLDETLMKR